MRLWNKKKSSRRRNAMLAVVAILCILAMGWLFYRELNPALPYRYEDLPAQSAEFQEASAQLAQLRSAGWEVFLQTCVHPKCRENPMLEYAAKQLTAAEDCQVVSVDAFGERMLRVIVEVQYADGVKYFSFLLSRGPEQLWWETTNL